MRKMMSFLVGAMTGAMVGATIAILLAPYSGEQLQNEIQGRVTKVQEEMKKAAADRRAELEDQLATLRAPQKTEPPAQSQPPE